MESKYITKINASVLRTHFVFLLTTIYEERQRLDPPLPSF